MGRVNLIARLRALPHAGAPARPVPHESPYASPNHLAHIVAPDWFPRHQHIDRAAAMAIPAVSRGRRIICTSIARLPMAAYKGDERLTEQPTWIDRTDGPVSPFHRMLWTVDDLLFYGVSAWAVQRGADGAPIAADRIPFAQWRIDDDGTFLWAPPGGVETACDARSVIVIPGSDEGLLGAAPTALAHARDLLASAAKAAENPAAYIDLHQTNDLPITDDDRAKLIAGWTAARRGENGGVAFSSAGIEVRELGAPVEHLLVEGRNAAALDVARALGIPGSMIDATSTEGLTYTNADAKQADLINFGLAGHMAPITARLGLDDMSPRGTRIAFDLESVIGPGATAATPDDGGASTAAPKEVTP